MTGNITKLLILGAGGLARDLADLLSDMPEFALAGFVVNMAPFTPGSTLLDLPIYWIDELPHLVNEHLGICATGTTMRYRLIEQAEALGLHFATVIHPSSRVSRTAQIGEGVFINAGVQVAAHSVLNRHVIVNRGALLGHDDHIGEYATIGPGANLAGFVSVGARAFVGMGANIVQRLTVGERAVVGAGAVVTKDVPPATKVIGMPARVVQTNVDGL